MNKWPGITAWDISPSDINNRFTTNLYAANIFCHFDSSLHSAQTAAGETDGNFAGNGSSTWHFHHVLRDVICLNKHGLGRNTDLIFIFLVRWILFTLWKWRCEKGTKYQNWLLRTSKFSLFNSINQNTKVEERNGAKIFRRMQILSLEAEENHTVYTCLKIWPFFAAAVLNEQLGIHTGFSNPDLLYKSVDW